MAGNVKLVFTISKQAMKLVKAGKAVIESGGVRALDGSLLELAKPAVQTFTNGAMSNITSPINLVSSLANNVQAAFIQKGVNTANAKLDVSLEKLDQIQTAINGLSNANVLGWVNCAFGMANCAISVAGFYMTLEKLNEVSQKIDTLTDKIERQKRNDDIERFDKFRLNINSDIAALQSNEFNSNQTNIENHLAEIASFLKRVIAEFENKEIDGQLGCCLIFNLAIAFAQELKEYSAQFYYEKGTFPPNYESYLQILESINSDSFKNYLKQFLIFECMQIPMEERYAAYSGATYGIEYQLGNLEYNRQLVQQIEQKEYMAFDSYLLDRIKNGSCFEVEDTVCIYA